MADMAPPVGNVGDETESAANGSEIRTQMENLSRDIAELTRAISDYGSAKAGELGAEVADRSTAAYNAARDGVASVERDLEAHIRAKPVQSVAIAAGIGFLAAILTRR